MDSLLISKVEPQGACPCLRTGPADEFGCGFQQRLHDKLKVRYRYLAGRCRLLIMASIGMISR